MSKKVLDIEQMQHLQELGLGTSNASALYCIDNESGEKQLMWNEQVEETDKDDEYFRIVPAYTLQDILDLLPKVTENEQQLRIIFFDNRNTIVEYDSMKYPVFFSCKDLIDSAYEMLCWCIENGHIKTAK